ncbi:isoafricanol synthase [Streptomyces sp. PR69]|uniref:isoafricanol synthase n=1 Tax=Streptomyces sp. PR69 TaxID=2984950 RepID=UPI002B26CF1C|nr:isoafricanol synthase [Streptomyces sp. PR69]
MANAQTPEGPQIPSNIPSSSGTPPSSGIPPSSGRSAACSDPTRRTSAVRLPFPARFSPHAERARRHTLQWVQGIGLLTGDAAAAEYDSLRLERLMAYFYPDATAADLELAADFNAWFFIFDDQFDGWLGKRPTAVEGLVRTLAGTMTGDGVPRQYDGRSPWGTRQSHIPSAEGVRPLVAAFHDIWRRCTDGRPADWQRRFRAHWTAYMAAYRAEAQHRNAERLPSLERFLEVRRDSIGVQPCLDFTERCGGYSLPDELYGMAPLPEMREITADVVIFVNDIVSLSKELAAGDVNNSVIIHAAQQGCTPEESIAHIAALATARAARFAQLAASLAKRLSRRRVPAEVRGHIAHYVEGMEHLMAGNLAWSLATSRYGETGIAAVSGGRQRPWAQLAADGAAGAAEGKGGVGGVGGVSGAGCAGDVDGAGCAGGGEAAEGEGGTAADRGRAGWPPPGGGSAAASSAASPCQTAG